MSEENLPYHLQRLARKNGTAPPLPTKKSPKPIAKQSPKKKAEIKAEKDARGGGESELVKFYRDCMKRMTGHCLNCHNRTERHVYSAAIFSICHILDKRDTMCPSVKTHPCNWVELCPDCHHEFDTQPLEKNKTLWDKRENMGFWNVVRDKLIMVYPSLASDERRHFPESVIKYIEQNDPFKK